MILLTSDTPQRIIRDVSAYLQAREDTFAAWRELASAHFAVALAFRELAFRRQIAGCR